MTAPTVLPDRDRLSPSRSLSQDEHDHLAARPDWTDAWARVDALFAHAEATAEKMVEAAHAIRP